jgi:precorrin-2/cobalt-factor-2 C20-methyltransferase
MQRGPSDEHAGYDRIAQVLLDEAAAGRAAVYLTEGDPMLFGTGSYVVERLKALRPEAPVEIVPGVSALSAAAARLEWPLAQKDQVLTICPATYHPDQIGSILDRPGATCWLKAADVLPRLVEELEKRGRLERAALVERVGRPDERIFRDLTEALGEKLSYFSLVLVR